MARFDIYRNPFRGETKDIPFLLDVQSEFLDVLDTRMIIPLRRATRFRHPIEHLNPTFEHAGTQLVVDTASMASVLRSELRQAVGNMRTQRLDIENALDFFFTGI